MSEPNTTNNQVRQILMNELGLTREYIRGQVDDIVRATIEKHLCSPQFENLVERHIEKTVQQVLKTNYYETDSLKKLITASLKEKVSEAVSHLKIEVAEPSH